MQPTSRDRAERSRSSYWHRCRVSRRQGQRWAQQEEQQPAPVAAPAPEGGQSTIDQLKELGDLKAQGILTEEEFAAQKAKLLAS